MLFAIGFVHLHREPPTQRTGIALPLALDVYRHDVIHSEQFGERISSDIVLIGIDKVQFISPGGKVHRRLVLVNRLERSIVGDGSVTQRKAPWTGNPFRRLMAGDYLRREKKLLDLVFGEIGLVSGIHET